MHIESLRLYCLAKPGVTECLPFGPDTLVFKVLNKMFLLAALEDHPLSFNVKCDPDKAMQLREQYSCVKPGYHMNKKHWNTVTVDESVEDALLQAWIDHSYELIVAGLSKKAQLALESISNKS